MMTETYSAVVTELGASLIEDAYNNSTIVNITQMAIGDSNGAYVEPNPAFTSLVNELGREDIHESGTVGHLIHVYVYVTSKFAGDTIREFGLYDDANNLVVYAAYPESLVPDAASGEYIQLEIECIVDLENAEVVNIVVNPIYPHATELEAGIAKIATKELVDEGEDDSAFLTIKKLLLRTASLLQAGVVKLSSATDSNSEEEAATPKAVNEVYKYSEANRGFNAGQKWHLYDTRTMNVHYTNPADYPLQVSIHVVSIAETGAALQFFVGADSTRAVWMAYPGENGDVCIIVPPREEYWLGGSESVHKIKSWRELYL
ncbi:hypothetical protein CGK40_23230 [Vibrio parahaemolyticus]|uniref:phage tail protein n=1 Tax=Vibrio parahaemolyticus TaxID=670 RepID=UPI00111CA8F2|nr:phage tail protein [Vibrio parahaemolyticus]TNZ87694.1 hypothetical protein CGK40_23230 [Vibrio parahaemolyticus]